MDEIDERISRKAAVEEFNISLSSLDRAVKAGELHYANQDSKKRAPKYFTRASLENFSRFKPLKQRRAADITEKILKGPSSLEQSPLVQLVSKYLYPLPLDIVLEISTTSPRKGPRSYVSSFPLVQRASDLSQEAHAAAALALLCLILEGGGGCEARNFQAPGTASDAWGPNANPALQESADDICNRFLEYAHGWFSDWGAFEKNQKSHILAFLWGAGCGSGFPGTCLILDQVCLYTNRSISPLSGQYEQNGTTVTAYLAVSIP